MKTKLLLIVLALVVLFTLCACNQPGDDETQPGSESVSTPATDSESETETETEAGPKDVDMSGVSFNDLTVDYTGEEIVLTITGTLPEGVTVTYTGNVGTMPGKYNATASFTVPEGYNPVADMTAKLTINEAEVDMSGVSFENKTVAFTGEEITLEITGTLPEGVTVTYTKNKATMPGTYSAKATFKVPEGYKAIDAMNAKLIITEPDIKDTIYTYVDEEKTFLYQVEPSIANSALNLPDGIKKLADYAVYNIETLVAIYVPASVTEIGEYAVGYVRNGRNPAKLEGLVIYGEAGSAIEAYCEENGLAFDSTTKPKVYTSASDIYLTNGLTIWLDAFNVENNEYIDLTNGKWYSKLDGEKYATLHGGDKWWKTYANGGVGYGMTINQWTASAGEAGLVLDSALLNESGFTVEIIMDATGPVNEDGTRYVDDATNPDGSPVRKFGVYNPNYSAFDFGGLRCMQFGGSKISSHYMTRWFYHEKPWVDHQKMQWVIKDSTALTYPTVLSMTVTYEDLGSQHVKYAVFYNGTRDFEFDNTIHGSMSSTSNPYFVSEGGKTYIKPSEGNFNLLYAFPGVVYAVRVYDSKLDNATIARNHLADLVAYHNIDLSKYGPIFDSQLDALASSMKGFDFTTPKAEIEETLDSALEIVYNATVTVKFVKEDGSEIETREITQLMGTDYCVYSPSVAGYYTRDMYLRGTVTEDTEITVTYKKIPANVDSNKIKEMLPGVVCWGDSLTAGAGWGDTTEAKQYGINLVALGSNSGGATYVVTLENLIRQKVASGVTVTNCGVGGETSAVIAARAMTETYYLYLGKEVTVAPGGSITIDIQQYASSGRLGVLRQGGGNSISPVSITGKDADGNDVTVTGNLTASLKMSAIGPLPTCDYSEIVYTFTRTDNLGGDVTLASGAKIVTYGSYAYDGQWCVIFIGQNGGYVTVDELIKQQQEILDACQCEENYVIVGLSSGSYTVRAGMEEQMKEYWGDHYMSAREYLSSEQAYKEAGFPDVVLEDSKAYINSGTVSGAYLLDDGVHMNAIGYAMLGNGIFQKMLELGYFDEVYDYYDSLQG